MGSGVIHTAETITVVIQFSKAPYKYKLFRDNFSYSIFYPLMLQKAHFKQEIAQLPGLKVLKTVHRLKAIGR